ncbi:DUF402 domain-containing protein [Streptomyces sp. NPDC020965]|uniref:DUF402 domain-containing protein n=1 Tax=Streptomyces sp. NPDC020965 TaxID=3365105 RepID=UPI00378B0012
MAGADDQNPAAHGFGHGAIVERRDVLDGRPWLSYPVRVVIDSPRLVALYLSRGTQLRFGRGTFRWGAHPWQQISDCWQGAGVLQLHQPGLAHSVWVWKDRDTGAFQKWYINLEAPLRRNATGFSTLDHEIDLIVPSGTTSCRWKDLDTFEQRVRRGHFSPAEAVAIRVEAASVAQSVATGTQWWESSWSSWEAPHDWGPLSLQTPETEGL